MPDIEWHITDETGPETVIKTPQTQPPRWRLPAVILMIGLGIGLGLAYHSIPEPPLPRPTAVPPPHLTTLPRVEDTIEREAQALAHGDLRAFMRVQDSADQEWLDRQSSNNVFNAWGMPQTGAIYTIVESGTLPDNRVWADVVQFRDGRRFRETRFYRQQNNQWVRTRPVTDEAFWGSWQTKKMGHFSMTFRTRDVVLAPLILLRLEYAYQRICRDLRCVEHSDPVIASQFNYRVTLSGGIQAADQEIDLVLPSPRIAGLYLPGSDVELSDQGMYRFLTTDLIERIAGSYYQYPSWTARSALWAANLSGWELARLGIRSERSLEWVYLHSLDLPPLESLWDFSSAPNGSTQSAETSAFVKFVAETYGPDQVVNLLHEVGSAESWPEVIQHSGLSYGELQQKWQSWIKQLVESQS
jgi:hypothetical protein